MMGLSTGLKPNTIKEAPALTMKFKQSDRQIKRLERITTSHFVIGIGIDMVKETHVAQAACCSYKSASFVYKHSRGV
ncbi:hypothetical protein GGC63_004260 [Paenibacillus sp. OAS669]|nr:hypothetical protein [Paenibacillus sp. OAS669]